MKALSSHISLIYGLNLSMNSKQSRGKWADNDTQLAIPHQPSPCHTFNTRSLGACERVCEAGARRSRLLHQSLAPPVAFPSSATVPNSLHWSPLCFPPSHRPHPSSLLVGLHEKPSPLATLSVIGGLQRWHDAMNMPKTWRT